MIGSFTEAPIISVKVIFWTLFLRQGFIPAFAFSQILRRLKVWWHNNLSLSQHKVGWLILIFDDQVASKLQINPTHSLVSVLFLTSGSFNGVAVRIPDLVWECYLDIWGSQKHLPSCETWAYHDLEEQSFHILFHAGSFGDVLDTLTLLFSEINSLATPVKVVCKLQPRVANSFSAFLELCVKQFHCKWSLVIT